jgi:hypothetical protein
MEHRCGTRFVQNLRVTVETTAGVSVPATLCDVSASGALLRCPPPAPLYARVSVRLPSSAAEDYRSGKWIAAQIVRRSDEGFAIEWLEFSPPAVRPLLSRLAQGLSPQTFPRDETASPLSRAR